MFIDVGWQEDGVDDVDDVVVGFDVSFYDGGVVDFYVVVGVDGDFVVLDGGSFGDFDDVRSYDFVGDDVVGEDGCEFFFVGEECFEGVFGQCGESFIGGSEDGEGVFIFEGVDEVGSFDGGDEGVE